ncbi:MAG TPA: TonB-dependent receptor, partial [Myxococcota bacterium]
VDVVVNMLASVVTATLAPLPTAPPWTLRTALRVGDDEAFVEGIVVGRGAAPSTIFGTLPSGAYALVSLTTRLPLGDGGLAVRATVDNAFDVTTARDANQLPLPGRLLFVGLEVRP